MHNHLDNIDEGEKRSTSLVHAKIVERNARSSTAEIICNH